MAIAFLCSCGKALKAKEAFAGRKVKCPQCLNIVRIPRLDGAPVDSQADSDDAALAGTPPPGQARLVAGSPPALEIGSSDILPTISPLAKPVIRRTPEVVPKTRTPAANAPANAWVDPFLGQRATPWLPGDEERFQKGIRAPSEGVTGLASGMFSLAVLLGLGVAGWLLVWNK